MTLIVSLRVPDGVVIAGDSLQTTKGSITPEIKDLKTKDNTGREVTISKLKLSPLQIPTSTLPNAQKLFPFNKRFGIGAFGNAIVNQRTMYNHFKNLESQIETDNISIMDFADKIKEYFSEQRQEELSSRKQDVRKDGFAFGFQIVGYENKDDVSGKTVEVNIGNPNKIKVHDGISCTISGDNVVVQKLWELGKQKRLVTNYGAFSLQDAIDYAEFLINTTASFQRFANMIPTVGGAVDIALVTSYSGFNWIKTKALTKILEKL